MLRQLRERLEHEAGAAELIDVAFRTVDSPVGRLLVATTERGLVRVAFESEGHDAVLDVLSARISPRILRSGGSSHGSAPGTLRRRLDETARELDAYFAGRLQAFDVPLDFSLSSGFRQAVQRELTGIGYGRTMTYREMAELVGNPKAVRAVGTACATNPLPVVVPCHRVLRTDGSLGGYLGGFAAKAALLDLERGAAPLPVPGSRGDG
ncbi:methylated-DNA--[protein]-cysteine S-methyltransferase [Zhihengliuella sp.]|uniref:methylated-DNA--[protein]-cysteine S-methyltransferase n=1 Tax=Zhihengliuella sp. TaxID=1954483 RepID=UPI002810E8DC|nr:methylated-DNA--[protein]-cysteine S-methyltransferase [Zhihengliuella sp.]